MSPVNVELGDLRATARRLGVGDCRRWSGPFAKFSRGEKGEKFHDDGANGPYLAVHRLFLFLLASGGPGVARNLGTFDSRFPAHERLAPTTAPIKGLGHLFSSPTPPHRAGHITSLLARVELHTDTSRALVLCSSRLHSPLCMATRRAPSFFLSEFGTVEENSRCRRACSLCAIVLDRHFVNQDFAPKIRGLLISALFSSRTSTADDMAAMACKSGSLSSRSHYCVCTVRSADTVVIACVIAIGDRHPNMMTARPRSGWNAIGCLELVGNIG